MPENNRNIGRYTYIFFALAIIILLINIFITYWNFQEVQADFDKEAVSKECITDLTNFLSEINNGLKEEDAYE